MMVRKRPAGFLHRQFLHRQGPETASVSALIVIALVLLLLYGGDRLGLVGKGLGEGVKAFRRTIRQTHAKESPAEIISVEPSPPKLLPAKGESSPESPGSDHERH